MYASAECSLQTSSPACVPAWTLRKMTLTLQYKPLRFFRLTLLPLLALTWIVVALLSNAVFCIFSTRECDSMKAKKNPSLCVISK